MQNETLASQTTGDEKKQQEYTPKKPQRNKSIESKRLTKRNQTKTTNALGIGLGLGFGNVPCVGWRG